MPNTDSYRRFRLGLDPIHVSISHTDGHLYPDDALSQVTSLKNSALAMAIGYCAFLELTGLPADLKAAGADDETVNAILNSENVNQWLATSYQESQVTGGLGSGFYQIDNAPADLAQNAQNSTDKGPWYAFLTPLAGGAAQPNAPINAESATAFVWQSVEKGYYEALSYLINKQARGDIPRPGFDFARWAVDYATHQTATHYPLPADEHPGIDIEPTLGFEQVMSYLYNRGQYPFVHPDAPSSLPVIELFKEDVPVNQALPYSEDPDAWGQKYAWQLPWLATLLDRSKSSYQEPISADDVVTALELLKGFFSGGNRDADPAVDAGIDAAKALTWGDAYDATSTFDNLYRVTLAMMEAAKQG
ncbi:hypothetical protein [Endothiovibrio diazotrophicus]